MASPAKKPKIKIVTKRPDPSTSELARPSLTRDGQAGALAYGSKATELGVLKNCSAHTAGDGKQMQPVCGTKRGPEEMVDLHSRKRIKMDRIMVCKCSVILKKLMKHQYGPAFNEPVDPVALNIPDYFSIISKPMDLGTIKSKLEKNMYATSDEFEADIKLTFSNAKQYNPPGNIFHKMAQELNSLFSAQWRYVGLVRERESIKGEAEKGPSDEDKKLHDVKGGCQRMFLHHSEASPRRSTPLTEKININCSRQESSGKVRAKDTRILKEGKNQIHRTTSKLSGSCAVSSGARSSVQMENVCLSSTDADVLDGKSTEFTKKKEAKKMFVPASNLSGSNAVSSGAKRSVQMENVCPRSTHASVSRGKSTKCTKKTEPKKIFVLASNLSGSDAVSPGANRSVQGENACPRSMIADVLHGKSTEFTKKTESKNMSIPTSKLRDSHEVSPGAKKSVQVEKACPRSTHADDLHGKSIQSTKKTEPKKMNEASIGKKVPLGSTRTSNGKAPPSNSRTCEQIVDKVAKNCRPLEICSYYPDSVGIEGSLGCLDEPPATFASATIDSKDWRFPSCETQLSPAKALRAEMLRRRFADTIWKAQHQTLLHSGENVHQVKMDIDKQRLGGRQHEEKLKTEAEVKASRDRQECECKMKRQQEREAARIALEKMEKSVEFEDNMTVLKDLASMIDDSSFTGPLRGYSGMYVAAKEFVNGKLKSPLERLGLFLKEEDEYMFGDDHGHDRHPFSEDLEEGELIFSSF